jgi:hypothetical protein
MHKEFRLNILKEEDHSEYLGADERKILKWIFGKYDRRILIGLMWLRICWLLGSCEHSNVPSVLMKGGEFLD